ncbi:hypothetical protein Deba_2350 [Desulfarculus baarsii DSM 2075]|uniref:FlgN family protein n=1 Tax=Desulfarculus baarsii (strain ATCC 33931 / DSM 2075 / LMG 7858 / VKM B-1802 / 2st14) TaxID=644282 RepID=E1QJG9_DESB2|nr:hypothetical protein [Desulfarculus baarsii]ADK85712.1 hypothetical protein Deba_2350 [Desulfarculus baarsii DSM 2075]
MSDPRALSKNLASRLGELRKLHQELNSLAHTALALLRQNQLEALDDLWAKRRNLWTRIGLRQRKLAPAFDQWSLVLAELPAQTAAQRQQEVDDIRDLAQQTLELDQLAVPMLERAMDDLRGQMKKLDAGKKLVRAYSRNPTNSRPRPGFSRNG